MNEPRRQFIQDNINFNNGWKDVYAKKFYGKTYGKLTRQEQLDIDDIVRGNNE